MKQYCEILSFIFVPFFLPRILVMIAMVVLNSTRTIIVTMSMISMIVISIVTSLSDKRWIYWGWPEAKGRRGPELKLRRYPEVFQRPSAVETVLHSKRKPVRRSYKRRVVENVKGIVHNFFYRSNLIFWIVMGCGIADFGSGQNQLYHNPLLFKIWDLNDRTNCEQSL